MNVIIEEKFPVIVPHWCDIFNTPEFYKIHQTDLSFYLSFVYKNRIVGVCHFTEIRNGVVRSPFKGTYGGISLSEELSFEVIYDLIGELLAYLKERGISVVELVSGPFSHNLNKSSVILNVFLAKGFFISNHEINHSITVDEEFLVNKMMRNNRKRYNKCLKENFRFECCSISDIEDIYDLIKENRESNGYRMSMSIDAIIDMHKIFPDNLHFFCVKKLHEIVAASICLKLSGDVLYVFYWADRIGYEAFSPVVFLANGIYDFSKEFGFKILDIGTSSLNGIPNQGLIKFKENLGFSISPKLTFTINI
jgi:hypothetical protein